MEEFTPWRDGTTTTTKSLQWSFFRVCANGERQARRARDGPVWLISSVRFGPFIYGPAHPNTDVLPCLTSSTSQSVTRGHRTPATSRRLTATRSHASWEPPVTATKRCARPPRDEELLRDQPPPSPATTTRDHSREPPRSGDEDSRSYPRPPATELLAWVSFDIHLPCSCLVAY